MPIYAYRCESCGHAKDVLQKVSDPVLTTCPACFAETFKKQLTAAGFQLKGSGWYVTDFRGGNSGGTAPAKSGGEGDAKPEAGKSEVAKPADAAAASSTSSASTDTGSSSGGGTCGGSCACH